MKVKSILGLAAIAMMSLSVSTAQASNKAQDLKIVKEKGSLVAMEGYRHHGGFHHGGYHHGGYHHGGYHHGGYHHGGYHHGGYHHGGFHHGGYHHGGYHHGWHRSEG